MKRIDLMDREEIVKLLSRRERDFKACKECPAGTSCGGSSCTEAIFDHLFEEVEVIPRASLYKNGEEACEEFFGSAFHDHKYSEPDILDFAEFLMEKVPKPLDK